MPDRSRKPLSLPRKAVATAGTALSIWMMAVGTAWPQTTPPPPVAPAQQPAQPAVPDQPAAPPGPPAAPQGSGGDNPGVFNEMGKMLEKSLSILPTLKSPSQAIDDLNARARDVAKDAGESLSRLAKPSSLVTGRVACPASANGAPDCKAGADRLCQSNGFKEGRSLNSDSAQACSAKVLIPGRARKPDDCRTDYFVTRALCQ